MIDYDKSMIEYDTTIPFLFSHFFFPASGRAMVAGCHPFSRPVLGFNFFRALGSAIPLLVEFSPSFANSRSPAFHK